MSDAYVKLALKVKDPLHVELTGYSDGDWAGDPSTGKSQRTVKLKVTDVRCHRCPHGRAAWRQEVEMAEYYAMCSTTEVFLQMRANVNTMLLCDSVAARGMAQRSRLVKVKALAIRTLQPAPTDQASAIEGEQG